MTVKKRSGHLDLLEKACCTSMRTKHCPPGVLCAVLRAVAVNCQKRAVDFLRARSILIKMHLSLISHAGVFLICDTHRKLLWWNIVVGNFRPNKQKLLTIALLLTNCWQCNEHVSKQVHFGDNFVLLLIRFYVSNRETTNQSFTGFSLCLAFFSSLADLNSAHHQKMMLHHWKKMCQLPSDRVQLDIPSCHRCVGHEAIG